MPRLIIALARLVVIAGVVTAPHAMAAGFGDAQPAYLPADEAFIPDAWLEDGSLTVAWQIAPGYYLYDHALDVRVDGTPVTIAWPVGQPYEDEHFGTVTIYRDQLFGTRALDAAARVVTVEYQGCADAGLCYPPMSATLPLTGE